MSRESTLSGRSLWESSGYIEEGNTLLSFQVLKKEYPRKTTFAQEGLANSGFCRSFHHFFTYKRFTYAFTTTAWGKVYGDEFCDQLVSKRKAVDFPYEPSMILVGNVTTTSEGFK